MLVLLVVADGFLTNILVGHGIAREWNPVLEQLAGKGILVAVKILGGIVCALVIWDIRRHSPKLGTIVAYATTAMYALIDIWNVTLLLSAVA